MRLTAELSQADLVEIVRSVFQYNKQSVTAITLVDSSGSPIEDARVLVECNSSGLRVRLEPEECEHMTPEETVRFFSQMNVDGGNAPQ